MQNLPTTSTPRILTASIATLLLVASALPIFAQTPTELLKRPVTDLPEVVVTGKQDVGYRADSAVSATRIAAPIIDTPRSVTVVNPQLIQDRQMVDPQEAVKDIPGVVRSGGFNGFGENYIVRGYPQEELLKDGFRAGATSGPASGLTGTGPTDMANIDRIEALSGPSSILYGRGQPGGVINYLTRTADFTNHFSLEQQVGSYDFYRTDVDANWVGIPDRLAVRLDAAYQRGDSFIDDVSQERYFVAPSFVLKLDSATTLTFKGEYSHNHDTTDYGLPYVNGALLPNVAYNRYLGDPGVTDLTNQSVRGLLQLEHRWTDDIITTLSVNSRATSEKGNYYILFNFAGPLINPVNGDVSRALANSSFGDDETTVRLDQVFNWTLWEAGAAGPTGKDDKGTEALTKPFAIKNQLLLSGEFDHENIDTTRLLSGLAPINPSDPNYSLQRLQPLFPGAPLKINEITHLEDDDDSLLVMDRVSFGETVYLSLGGRFEWFGGDRNVTYPTGPFASSAARETPYSFQPTAGIVIKPARSTSLYFNYAESRDNFQSFQANTASGSAVAPEASRQYEAGVKQEFLDKRLLMTLAVFQVTKANVVGPDPTNPLFDANDGAQRSRGFEFQVGGEILPGWRVQANYAYVDARTINDPTNTLTNLRLFGAPENSGGIFTTYEIQGGVLKGLGFGAGVYLSDKVEINNSDTGSVPGYAETDALIYYKRDRFRAQLNIKNLFDSKFYYAENLTTAVMPAEGRAILFSLKYEF